MIWFQSSAYHAHVVVPMIVAEKESKEAYEFEPKNSEGQRKNVQLFARTPLNELTSNNLQTTILVNLEIEQEKIYMGGILWYPT